MTAVRITLDNKQLVVSGANRRLLSALTAVSSYKVAGYYWSEAFKAGWWDGREKLLKFNKRSCQYTAPIGLLDDFLLVMNQHKVEPEIVDERPEPPEAEVGWSGKKPRPYQLRAIRRVIDHPTPLSGCGIINMPIRSGKTFTAAGLIVQLGVRTLFVVPSTYLLHQAMDALGELLQVEIGQLGEGVYNIQDITVTTIQTLSLLRNVRLLKASAQAKLRWNKFKQARKDELPLREYVKQARANAQVQIQLWLKIKSHFGLVIMDECHHLTAGDWRKAVMDIEARYRVGLSATAYPDITKEQEKGVIWLKACCGPLRIRVSTDKLITGGWLAPARIIIQEVTHPNRAKAGWSQNLRDECILLNEHRNRYAISYAQRFAQEGRRILIVTNRHNQVRALMDLANDMGVGCDYVIGGHHSDERSQKVRSLIARDPSVLISTVLSEGADIPEVDVVINAEGGEDMKATIQRMRNLTASEDKDEAIFVDFMDLTSKYFKRHSKARLKVYQQFNGFKIERVKDAARR